jgi:hypothetical protein
MLDEPVAGMNRRRDGGQARFILDPWNSGGMTILLIEHDLGMVAILSNHVAVLNLVAWSRAADRGGAAPTRTWSAPIGPPMSSGRRFRYDSAVAPDFLEFSLVGLALGGLMRSIGLGFVLIYKATRVLNRHGESADALGASFYFTANVPLGFAAAWPGLFALVGAALSALAVERPAACFGQPTIALVGDDRLGVA